jgi:CRISPR/Cas system-associated endoribonuclease Cas2
MVGYIIIYDIPREKKVFQVQVNRALKKIKAKKFQHSVWESDDLEGLKGIAKLIKQEGGQASIMEKRLVM